jgi:hypothetical protein
MHYTEKWRCDCEIKWEEKAIVNGSKETGDRQTEEWIELRKVIKKLSIDWTETRHKKKMECKRKFWGLGKECGDYDDGMQEWDGEMEGSGDYDVGMQEWGMKMECTGDYDDGMQEWVM